MTDKMTIRMFRTVYKLKEIKRAEGGEGVLPVARKLGISRKLLHDWIEAWKAEGPAGLNRKRGPENYGDSASNRLAASDASTRVKHTVDAIIMAPSADACAAT